MYHFVGLPLHSFITKRKINQENLCLKNIKNLCLKNSKQPPLAGAESGKLQENER